MKVSVEKIIAGNIAAAITNVFEKYHSNEKNLKLKLNVEGKNTDEWIMCDPNINGENKEKIIDEIEALLMRHVSIGTRHIYVTEKLV